MKAATQRDFAIWESRTGWGEQYPIWTLDELRKEFPELEIVLIDIADPGVLNSIVEEPGLKFGFNLGISRRLPDTVLEVFSGGVINVHPGLLPRYRGSSAVEWAILEKEFVGCSVHLMVAELDGGPLTLREKYVFPSSFRYRDVRQFVYERQVFLLTNFAERAQRGIDFAAHSRAQASQGHVYRPPTEEAINWLSQCPRFEGPSFSSHVSEPTVLTEAHNSAFFSSAWGV